MIGDLRLPLPQRRGPRTPPAATIDPRRYESLGELLRDALVQFKTSTALVEMTRKRESARYTYLDFHREAMRVAAWLEREGVSPGDRVAILMGNQPRWLIGAYAALYRGAILVPLDYKLTAAEQAALVAHARPKALLVEEGLARRFGPGALQVPSTLVSERWDELPAPDAPPAFVPRARTDTATIVYSSGTAGRPKGCMLSHDSYLEQLRGLVEMFPIVQGDRYFSVLPTNHAIDFMVGFVGPMCGGAAVIHQRTLRPEFVRWTMQSQRITHMAVVPLLLEAFERSIDEKLDAQPPMVRGFVEALSAFNEALTQSRPRHALSRRLLGPVHDGFGGALSMLFCGGAFVDRARAERFYRLGIPVVIGYGLTEACTVVTVNDLEPFRADSVGKPVSGVEVRIADPDAAGIGEVLVRGRTLMQGYLDDPELTAETIRDGWLHTGDLGWVDASGHLHLVGRAKNMIVTAGGKNVYPEDVEAAFDGVDCEELAVVASNYVWREERPDEGRLLIVARPRKDGDRAALARALRERNRNQSDYKRASGLVLWEHEMPRTASMKLKREALAEELRTAVAREAVEAL